jgi:hypothetical protein
MFRVRTFIALPANTSKAFFEDSDGAWIAGAENYPAIRRPMGR